MPFVPSSCPAALAKLLVVFQSGGRAGVLVLLLVSGHSPQSVAEADVSMGLSSTCFCSATCTLVLVCLVVGYGRVLSFVQCPFWAKMIAWDFSFVPYVTGMAAPFIC